MFSNSKLNFYKKILLNKYSVIAIIIILAYILRILPYLLGYPLPFTEDGINDFNEIKKFSHVSEIIVPDNNDYYAKHVSFPVLRLTVLGISKIGIDPLKTFLFFPQIFPCLGILFFFLFLKKYFSKNISLLACFLIAVFGPHIHWSAQPVIETMGLFFFPLIIYLFDKEVCNQRPKNVLNKVLLFLSFALMIASHHWSTLMIIGWLVFYILIFVKEKKQRIYATLLTLLFISCSIAYWYFLFPEVFNLILEPLALPLLLFLIAILALIFFLKPNIKFEAIISRLQIKKWPLFIIIPILLVLIFIIIKLLPLTYPIQIWAMLFLFAIFILTGFFYARDEATNKLTLTSIFFILIWLIAAPYILTGHKIIAMPVDPFRTFEFIIFPLSVSGAIGMLTIFKKNDYGLVAMIAVMVFLATMIYPSIFIYKNNFAGTPFYDIRSDIRYLPPTTMELIGWASNHGYHLDLLTPEARAYQNLISNNPQKNAILITKNDKTILDKYYLIHDPIMRIDNPEQWQAKINNNSIIYQNNDGIIAGQLYDAQFISQKIPAVLVFNVGQKVSISFTLKNTGAKPWLAQDGIKLADPYNNVILNLDETVLPDETVTFSDNSYTIPDLFNSYPATNQDYLQMFKPDIGWFGQQTPKFEFTIKK